MSKEVALINSEAVLNVIIADDDFISHISKEYDYVIDISGMDPRPGIGWSYIDREFVLQQSEPTIRVVLNEETGEMEEIPVSELPEEPAE